VLDLDTTEAAQRTIEQLRGYEIVYWETYKSGLYECSPGQYEPDNSQLRMRVVVFLDRPIDAAHWDAAAVARAFPLADPKALALSQLAYCLKTWSPDLLEVVHEEGRLYPSENLLLAASVAPVQEEAISLILTREHLKRLVAKLKNRARQEDLGKALAAVCKGDAYAEPGTTHETSLRLTYAVMAEFPKADIASAVTLFTPSLLVMHRDDGGGETVETIEAMLRDAQRKIQAGLRLTDFELPFISKSVKPSEPGQPLDIDPQYLALTNGRSWYFYQGDGTYGKGHTGSLMVEIYTQKLLAPFVETFSVDDKGNSKPIPYKRLLSDYGHLVSDVRYKVGPSNVYNKETDVLELGCCWPRRDIKPVYSQEIDTILRALAGEEYEALCDWLAAYLNQDLKPRILYLMGARGLGKGFILRSLAQCYGQEAGLDIDSLYEWNSQLLQCPIIYIDEEAKEPPSPAQLRKLIDGPKQALKKKYADSVVMDIAPRIVIAANDHNIFNTATDMTPESIDATKDRFLFIPVQTASRDLFPIDRAEQRHLSAVLFPNHIAWLRENREIPLSRRWAGRPGNYDVGKLMTVHYNNATIVRDIVLSWLLKLSGPAKSMNAPYTKGGPVWIGSDGAVYLTLTWLQDRWKDLHQKTPTTKTVVSGLNSAATRTRLNIDEKRVWCWRIDPEGLAMYAEEMGHELAGSRLTDILEYNKRADPKSASVLPFPTASH
jgi:hypothetical protein